MTYQEMTARQETLSADYVAGTLPRADYVRQIVELHRSYSDAPCGCLSCREARQIDSLDSARREQLTMTTHQVVVIDARQANPFSEEDGGRWITYCETHGQFVQHETRALARDWLHDPDMYCTGPEGSN